MKDVIKEILVPTDGTEESEAAFAAILPLVKADAPEVTLLYVFENTEASFLPPARVAKVCKGLRNAGVNAHLELRQGKPAQQILGLAKDKPADLIALSTHGRGGVRRLLSGSVAEEVLRHAEAPLLITRPGINSQSWKRIVVALDGSEHAESVLPEAFRLARKLGSSLDLVQVALPVITPLGVGEIPVMVLPPDDPLPYLRNLVERARREGVDARAVGLAGVACPEILRYLEESGAGLLCLATHGRTGLARVILGSTAEELLRRAPCPVLLRRSVLSSGPSVPEGVAQGVDTRG
jgi:nucleotide-binding universal stress UspA family protein